MNDIFGNKINEIFNFILKNFKIDSEILKSILKNLNQSFNSNNNDSQIGFYKIDYRKIETKDDCINKVIKEACESKKLVGFDIPIFIDNKKKQNIFIIGQDPKRSKRDFGENIDGNIIIGTPYAIHSNYYTSRLTRTKIYKEFIEYLGNYFNIYCTDVEKVYIEGKNKLKSTSSKFLIEEEINYINPSKIICFGNIAKEIISTIKPTYIEYFKCEHPSGINKNWNKLIKATTVENKIKYLKSWADDYIINK